MLNNILMSDSSTLFMHDGLVQQDIQASHTATVYMFGGSVQQNIQATNSAIVTIDGGSVLNEVQILKGATVTLNSGSIAGINGSRDSSFYIYGGSISTGIVATDRTYVEIYGGSIGTALNVEDDAFVYIYGGDFSVDGGATLLPDGYYLSAAGPVLTLEGVLKDGSPFSTVYDMTLITYGDIFLTVISVPDVVDMSQVNAISTLTDEGYTGGTITEQYNGIVAAGSVISQNPVAGTTATPGSAVDLIVSIGPCLLLYDTNDDCVIDIKDIANIASVWLIDCNITPTNAACI